MEKMRICNLTKTIPMYDLCEAEFEEILKSKALHSGTIPPKWAFHAKNHEAIIILKSGIDGEFLDGTPKYYVIVEKTLNPEIHGIMDKLKKR